MHPIFEYLIIRYCRTYKLERGSSSSNYLDVVKVKYRTFQIEYPNSELYIHRVGRTARVGRSGVAISLLNQYEVGWFKTIEELMGGKKVPLYTAQDVEVLLLKERVSEAKRSAEKATQGCIALLMVVGYPGLHCSLDACKIRCSKEKNTRLLPWRGFCQSSFQEHVSDMMLVDTAYEYLQLSVEFEEGE